MSFKDFLTNYNDKPMFKDLVVKRLEVDLEDL